MKNFAAWGKHQRSTWLVVRGFTLIEVILSLSLTAMLLGLLSTGIFVVSQDWSRNTGIFDQVLDESLAVLQIERALHGAFPHSFTYQELLSREIFFAGEEDSLRWVSTVSPQRQPGLTAWELTAVEDEGIYLRTVPAFSDDPGPRLDSTEATLLMPDYSLEFAYLYENLNEERVWTESWLGEEQLSLPQAVYVRFIPAEVVAGQDGPLEVLARIRTSTHRTIPPNQDQQRVR
ncbi:MAG: prepilin-type N-terminal cleavage/methylation domain-containing protein [Gammaproteobacteria bacterium]|nr:prepilin-type N-terminal cleavage/methylation domain-containing protein [Gammaproteobacteria bacterium]MCY4357433.1 prepilin-type N-terminal cleavage/methylation domain-containing protein [Gammaproteobacteria bacterium]